jgi:hypothetical protein
VPQRLRDSQRTQEFLEHLLAAFGGVFARPSTRLPTVRCVSRTVLSRLLTSLRDDIGAPGYTSFAPGEMIASLTHAGLLHQLPVDFEENAGPRTALYLVGLETSTANVDPVELLVGWEPEGVLCYFTALQLHSLTTQVPSHHHIARLTTQASTKTIRDRGRSGHDEGADQRRFDPLGTLQFRYEGVSYYRTNRESRLMPGTVARDFSDKTRCRVTTLEQTLIDTLHRPLACGGPPVVLEAWTRGVSDLSPARLHDYLVELGDDRITRRIGHLLEMNDFRAKEPLLRLLEVVRSRSSGAAPISLLPGIPYIHLDTAWQITGP